MAITGGVKFFKRNKNLSEDGATATASTGEVVINRALDKNPLTKWRSVGSSDATTETITISYPEDTTINRVILQDHNWETFTVQYDSGGVFTDFTTVVGLDGSLGGGISETTFADDTAYYEFDSVTTSRIQITVTTTQTADEDKFISQIISTEELGTLQGFPLVRGLSPSRNLRRRKVLSGKSLIQKSEESVRFRLDFKNFGSTFTADLDLMFTLFEREDNFLTWLSGGKRGTDNFRYTLRGFRLKDIFEMQIDRDFPLSYRNNVYVNPVNVRVSLTEAV